MLKLAGVIDLPSGKFLCKTAYLFTSYYVVLCCVGYQCAGTGVY